MIHALVTDSGWHVSVGKLHREVCHRVESAGQPDEPAFREPYRMHECLSWIFRQFEEEGYVPSTESITVAASSSLKPFLSGTKIPKSKEGMELVSKSRNIIKRFKYCEFV